MKTVTPIFPTQAKPIKPGDVVFFKAATTSAESGKARGVAFKGHGFGLMLGLLPPLAKDPPAIDLLRLMGTIGFISFDDIKDFLGKELMEDAVKQFEDRYYGVEAGPQNDENSPPQAEILDVDGNIISPTSSQREAAQAPTIEASKDPEPTA